MSLSLELVSQFAKVLNDDKKEKQESTVYGTIKIDNGVKYIQIDGSELYTPISITADVENDERVTATIKDHSVIVNGNITSPSVGVNSFGEISNLVLDSITATYGKFTEAEIDNLTVKEKITAAKGYIEDLETDSLTVNKKLTAAEASIGNLTSENATITGKLDAAEANIINLTSENATITGKLDAAEAKITTLETNSLTAESADIKYAQIDCANITDAALKKILVDSGMLKNATISDLSVTGELDAVTINADLIQSGTLVADRLMIKTENGLLYKLNAAALGENGLADREDVEELKKGLHGAIINDKTIVAEKIKVDDIEAFDATIGGFNITEHSLYSGVKASSDNTTRGIFLGDDGQLAIGDSSNYLKFYKVTDDTDETYKLAISADTINFGASGTNIETAINDANDKAGSANNGVEQVFKDLTEMFEKALEKYVSEENYTKEIDDVRSQINQNSSDITLSFEQSAKYYSETTGQLELSKNELAKYFRFDTNGIEIGEEGNTLKLTLDNNKIAFRKNGEVIGWWDGTDFYTGNIYVEVQKRAQFGNFAFIPRSDGSLSFLKVGGT